MITLRFIFYGLFILLNFTILGIIDNLQKQDKCECNTGWKPENLKLISNIGIVLGIVNILLPINKTLYSIPIISTIFSILCLGIVFMYLFTAVRYFRNLRQLDKCRKTCTIRKSDEPFVNFVSTLDTLYIVIIGAILAILILYL